VRRHGNLAENAAIFIASVSLLELLGGGRLWVEILCGVFLLARLLHAFGLSQQNPTNIFRIAGVILTAVAGLAVGVRLIWIAIPHVTG
jgi:hypothetical protein